MNQIYIGEAKSFQSSFNTYFVPFEEADRYLQILRGDYFNNVTISLPNQINDKQLRFMMHLTRILKHKGQVILLNQPQTVQTKAFANLAAKLGLFSHQNAQNTLYFSKTKPQQAKVQTPSVSSKVKIGFKSVQAEQIDEDELMKNENIIIQKSKAENCAQKPRACANCNCSRKNDDQPSVNKQTLVQSINDGKPVSGCGKCYLGDSFRCGSCPYKGLPAFKPGDKLKLMDQGQVVVQTGPVKVQSGKVKIQL